MKEPLKCEKCGKKISEYSRADLCKACAMQKCRNKNCSNKVVQRANTTGLCRKCSNNKMVKDFKIKEFFPVY